MDSMPVGFVSPDLVVVGLGADTREEVLRIMGGLLYDRGYVTETWAEAALERESGFPTGLPTQDVRVAIPHTGVQYCLKPGIAVATLAHPVQFLEMATTDSVLEVEVVFCLSVTRPKEQVIWLKRLVSIFERPGFLRRLKSAPDAQACYSLLCSEIGREATNDQNLDGGSTEPG
jgi:PTS system galactitol-specific IIA component